MTTSSQLKRTFDDLIGYLGGNKFDHKTLIDNNFAQLLEQLGSYSGSIGNAVSLVTQARDAYDANPQTLTQVQITALVQQAEAQVTF